MQTLIRIVVILVATGLLVAGWDFSRFVARADRAVTPDPPLNADAVAALTGGADARIITAIQLADSLDVPSRASQAPISPASSAASRWARLRRRRKAMAWKSPTGRAAPR